MILLLVSCLTHVKRKEEAVQRDGATLPSSGHKQTQTMWVQHGGGNWESVPFVG